ncbi:chemotaxis protein CheB [Lacisediminimonas profundi]|uniref:chemotaxis protein CheB n=1 Tax=Lacisediminimonas profundi TaxID=2603856 RepID=UPI00124B5BB0|nr:chemotaxis protein CheB [Lacisediminimonas profundi]
MDEPNSDTPYNENSVRRPFPIVGIGASAGGLQAIIRLLERLPADSGMAFVVVLHLSPKHESIANEVLQRATRMPVLQVMQPVAIEANHVYVIPPNRYLVMSDGMLRVEPQERPRGQNIAVDIFFRTLADTHLDRAIAVVLSGTGADGAMGAARIKDQGGIVIAQSPEDAEHSGMPEAALNSADFVLPVNEIPDKLLEIWRNAQKINLAHPTTGSTDNLDVRVSAAPASLEKVEVNLGTVIALLRSSTGHDFRHYKRATVLRRIERRMQVRGTVTLAEYCQLLKKDSNEPAALLKDMLIGVTNFFRDHEAFEALQRDVIPEIFRGKEGTDQVRVWVPACSTGEEPYSIGMLLIEHATLLPKPPEILVIASDIDERAIAIARAGIYAGAIVTEVSPGRLRQFFSREEERYRIRKLVRDRILFAAHNILRDPPFSRLDLISCRNLLIYLNRDVQTQVLEMFHFALNPGGYLFLGSSESADVVSNLFTPVDKKNHLYRAKSVSRQSRTVPTFPIWRDIVPPKVIGQPRARKHDFSIAEIHQRVLAQFAPPSVIVDSDANIVFMSDQVGRFLRHVGGEPSRNIVSLVLPELRLELRTALFQAQNISKGMEARRVELERGGHRYCVNMIVRPFHDNDAEADLVLITFDEVEQSAQPAMPKTADGKDPLLHQLEEELQRTKEQLQDTIEQSEVGTEELRASNEELQAINEELRSATEELETGKEELQSVNEELITVNYELRKKVEETSKVNDDLRNLITSTDIATLFVDRGMRIKRFTPRANDIFSIIPSDIGRSLLDITHRLEYPQLADDIASTLETLQPVERELPSNDGRFYIVRLLPYRTIEDKIDGAVMTFFDITRRRKAEENLRFGEESMRMMAESTRDYAIITSDLQGMVRTWNRGAQLIFGYTEAEMLGQSADILFLPEDRQKGIPQEDMRRAREEGRAEDERWHLHKDGNRLYCSGVLTPLLSVDADDNIDHGADALHGYAWILRDETRRMQSRDQRDATHS